MAHETRAAALPARNAQPAPETRAARPLALERAAPGDSRPLRALLIARDQALVRAFQRELRRCDDCAVSFDVQPGLEAQRVPADPYDCVTVDLDGAVAPSEAVRLARHSWPQARIAVLSHWWSEREQLARELADLVIHKPLRAAELRAFLRSPAGAPRARPAGRETRGDALAASTR